MRRLSVGGGVILVAFFHRVALFGSPGHVGAKNAEQESGRRYQQANGDGRSERRFHAGQVIQVNHEPSPDRSRYERRQGTRQILKLSGLGFGGRREQQAACPTGGGEKQENLLSARFRGRGGG